MRTCTTVHHHQHHFHDIITKLKPLVLDKVAMLREVDQLDLVMDKLDHIVADPFNKLNSSDEILSFVKVKWTSEKVFSLPLTQY